MTYNIGERPRIHPFEQRQACLQCSGPVRVEESYRKVSGASLGFKSAKHMTTISRTLERITNHSTNRLEDVIPRIEDRMIKH